MAIGDLSAQQDNVRSDPQKGEIIFIEQKILTYNKFDFFGDSHLAIQHQ
jgi:hypothetical protein